MLKTASMHHIRIN